MNSAAARSRYATDVSDPVSKVHESRTPLSLTDAIAALGALLALAYLLDVAGAQTRLILFLQAWSTLLRGSNESIFTIGIALFPYAIGGLLLTLCAGMLRSDSVPLRRKR